MRSYEPQPMFSLDPQKKVQEIIQSLINKGVTIEEIKAMLAEHGYSMTSI